MTIASGADSSSSLNRRLALHQLVAHGADDPEHDEAEPQDERCCDQRAGEHFGPDRQPQRRDRDEEDGDECHRQYGRDDLETVEHALCQPRSLPAHYNGILRRPYAAPRAPSPLRPCATLSGVKTLPDYLRGGLDLVFVGINPGMKSAATGHHYAGAGQPLLAAAARIRPRLRAADVRAGRARARVEHRPHEHGRPRHAVA